MLAVARTGSAQEEDAALAPRVRLGFDLRAGLAPPDDGYFNTSDYQHGTLRLFRLSLSAEVRAGQRAALLVEGVSENMEARLRALYLRITPWPERALGLQVGLVPPVFGAFPRRAYGEEGPLIGFPLAYQYLTTMRADAIPYGADDLLGVRGRGWYVPYPTGLYPPGAGVPLVSSTRWDTGVQVRVGQGPLELALALTRGTLCDPVIEDTNDGRQLAGRVAWHPRPDFTLGVSVAEGRYLTRSVTDALPPALGDDYRQQAVGLDLEHVRGHLVLRAEAIASRWRVPPIGSPAITEPLPSFGAFVEGRYRLAPGWTLGARVDRLEFGELQGTNARDTWDANVTRVEAGVSFTPRRHVSLRAVYQYNWRDTKYFSREGFVAAQLGLWF